MHIQTATISDVPEILELQHKAFLPVGEVLNWLDAPNITETIETAIEDFPKFTVLKMVADNGKIVGSVRGKVEDGSLFIGRLMVLPEYQRNGYAKELLHHLGYHSPRNRRTHRHNRLYGTLSIRTSIAPQRTARGLLGWQTVLEQRHLHRGT